MRTGAIGQGRTKKSAWLHWLKIGIGLAALVIVYMHIDQEESIWAVLTNANWSYVALGLALLIPNIFLAFYKWRFLLRNRLNNIQDHAVFGSLMLGYTLGLVTPGRLGELGRGLFFHDQDRTVITGLNVLDKAVSQVVFFTLGFLALLLLILAGNLWSLDQALPLLIPGGIGISILWAILLAPSTSRKVLHYLAKRFGNRPVFHAFNSAFDNIGRRQSSTLLSLSLIWILVIGLQYHVLVSAFADVSLMQSFQAVYATLFAKTLLPFAFGDLGIREGIAVFFYSEFNISSAAVFNASLLIFLINFLIPALCGIYYVFKLQNRQRDANSL